MKGFTVGLAWLCFCVLVEAATALDSPRPTLVFQAADPVVAWVERQGPVTVGLVARWKGGTWMPLGGALNRDPQQAVASVSLAVGPGGELWAAWAERPLGLEGKNEGSGLLHVARWDGGAWVEPLASPSRSTRTVADRPQLRLDSQGRPWVMWSEITPDFNVENVYLAQAEGKSWVMVDIGTLTTDVSSASRGRDFDLDARDTPVLAWSWLVYRHDFQVFSGPWAGRWTPWGAGLNLDPDRYGGAPAQVLDPEGRPTVAFLQAGDRGFEVVVKRWTGASWELVGTPGAPGARSPRVALGGASLFLGSIEVGTGLVLRRWDGSGWTNLPGPTGEGLNTPGAFVDTFELATDPQGRPWLVWAEDDARGQRLGLGRWNQGGWEIVRLALPYSSNQ